MKTLKTEQNTPAMEARVLKAARKHFHQRKNIHAVFEHGHWWIIRANDIDFTENYSVCDAEGPGSIDGFCFEQV